MRGKSVSFLISILILSLFMLFAPVHSTVAESVKLYVDPPSVVNPNVFFNVSVKIDNVVDLGGVQWELSWNPTLLRAVNMTEALFHEVMPQSEWDNIWRLRHEIDNVIGKATYAYLTVDGPRAVEGGYLPISGNHTTAVIWFQVRDVGNCSLTLAEDILANAITSEAMPHDMFSGFFNNNIPPPFLPPVPIDDAQVLIYVDPHRVKDESNSLGDTITVEVKLDSISNHTGLWSIGFTLEWNPGILECADVSEVVFHEALPESEWQNIQWGFWIDNVSGNLECEDWIYFGTAEETGAHAIFGNHTLAIITFSVRDVGKCGLHLMRCLPMEYNGGLARNVLYVTTDGYFSNMVNGDLNGDNIVDLYDAIQFAPSFGAYWNGDRWNEEADLNGDQRIDMFDAILLGQLFGHTN
jgi:hypothetical protein